MSRDVRSNIRYRYNDDGDNDDGDDHDHGGDMLDDDDDDDDDIDHDFDDGDGDSDTTSIPGLFPKKWELICEQFSSEWNKLSDISSLSSWSTSALIPLLFRTFSWSSITEFSGETTITIFLLAVTG